MVTLFCSFVCGALIHGRRGNQSQSIFLLEKHLPVTLEYNSMQIDHGQQWFHLWTSGATSPKRSLCGFAVRTILQVAVVLIHEDDVSSSNLGNDFLHQKGKINDGYSSKFWPYNNEPLIKSLTFSQVSEQETQRRDLSERYYGSSGNKTLISRSKKKHLRNGFVSGISRKLKTVDEPTCKNEEWWASESERERERRVQKP